MKSKPTYNEKARKCKVAMWDGDYCISGEGTFSAVKVNPDSKIAIITITLVKDL